MVHLKKNARVDVMLGCRFLIIVIIYPHVLSNDLLFVFLQNLRCVVHQNREEWEQDRISTLLYIFLVTGVAFNLLLLS